VATTPGHPLIAGWGDARGSQPHAVSPTQGRRCEVGFEDLERDPIGGIGSIYEALGLTGFEALRPRLGTYLGSIAGYRKNRHDGLPEPLRRRIAVEWGRSIDEWEYES
jgi:hypothetical protein